MQQIPSDGAENCGGANGAGEPDAAGNLLVVPAPLSDGQERVECLFETGEVMALAGLSGASGVRIERIVSHGQASPDGFWYDQPQGEWVALLCGSAELTIEGEGTRTMNPGDWVNLPAHTRHRVESTAVGTVWLAVHYPAETQSPVPS